MTKLSKITKAPESAPSLNVGEIVATLPKREIIRQIERKDAEQGHFYPSGQYRYGIKFYYGKLEKYNKRQLARILESQKFHGMGVNLR